MTGPPRTRVARLARAAAALLAAAAAAGARAEGLVLRLEPSYAGTTTFTTDETGRTTRAEQLAFAQRYRLVLDRQLYPNLRFSGGGLYDWTLGAGETPLGSSDLDQRSWSGFARLALTSDLVTGGAAYDRRESSTDLGLVGAPLSAPTLVRESYSLAGSWKPEGLPGVDLRVARAHTFERGGVGVDGTLDEAILKVGHRLESRLELEYLGRYGHPQDARSGTESHDLTQTARASYGRGFRADRGSMYASYSLQHHLGRTVAAGVGGEVATQAFPAGGLSLVEPLDSATPAFVTLNPNPALVDGDLSTPAGLDLGFAVSLAGDNRRRDLGVAMPNAQAEVNEIRVTVDAPLPAGIWDRISWSAYRSDDNVTWTAIRAEAPADDFEPFSGRFEIDIPPTRARYLKVVARPLLPAVTTDSRFSAVRVTEVQVFQVLPAEAVRGTTSLLSGTFNGSARYLLARNPGLAYDVSLLGGHDRVGTTYTVVNGLSLAQRLGRTVALTARADRSDSGDTNGHVGQFRLTSSLSADPIPTAGAALTYSGQATQRDAGWSFVNALTLVNRLDPYEGVSLSANGTYSLLTPEVGGRTQSRLAGASLSVTPHPKLALTGSYTYARSDVEAPGPGPDVASEQQRVEGTVSVTPVPALFASASLSRVIAGATPATLTNVALNVSPFPRGDLLLRVQYNETLDTGVDQRLRLLGPSLRWNVRRGAYLDVSYTYSETRSPVLDTSSRALFASFVATLG